jgi:replication factor A1
MNQLTEGALLQMMRGEKLTDPVVQVLGCKKIQSASSTKERYRMILSDGDHSISFAMLTAQGGIDVNSIIKIKRFLLSEIPSAVKGNQKVLVILDCETVVSGSEVGIRIGNPVNLSEDKASNYNTKVESPSSTTTEDSSDVGQPARKQMRVDAPNILNQSLSGSRIISQISTLAPSDNECVIKARVANKSEMRTWSNSRGEGKLFSFDLMDESGEIRCTAFRDVADKYFNYLQVDKVYYFSKCQVKPANKQFNTIKNEYEMTLNSDSVIEECLNDDGVVPQVKYNFVPIDSVASMDVGALVDVIGICKEASDIQTFTSRSTNRELKKRDVFLVDQSKTAITLTLWGSQADSFDGTNNPVVLIKGAKVGEFGGGKNLSTVMSSQIKMNPDIQECHRIKGWFEREGRDSEVKNLSERTGGGNFQTPWMSFKEVHEKGLGQSEKGDYFQTMATILLVRSENAIYKACPTAECNKKVIDLENGMYRCEKCNREYPNFKYRLLVSMNIGDWSDNQWVSLFSSEAEKILGKTSQEVGLAMENDTEAATAIFREANFKQFVFKCRAKLETYNDEKRFKTVVVKVDPVNFEEHNLYLLTEIEKLMS